MNFYISGACMNSFKTKRITVSGMMLAISAVLALVCAYIPFLQLPFGGGFTVASMLPVVVVAYMYGVKWGIFTSFCYAVIQITISLTQGASGSIMPLFMPSSDEFMGYTDAVWIIVIDYFVAYTVLGFGGVFRNSIKNRTLSLTLGVILALSLRYIAHIISGMIFYGAWAEWFFSQEGFYKIGNVILDSFSGKSLIAVYSVFYNGLYMIPETVITSVVAIPVSKIRFIRKMV